MFSNKDYILPKEAKNVLLLLIHVRVRMSVFTWKMKEEKGRERS